MDRNVHLIVEGGADKGKEISVPSQGARLGRSSKNDIVLQDPMLSRHHCRLFFREGALWVTDLGSANETFVNGKSIVETQIFRGDVITVGETHMRIVNDGLTPLAPPPAVPLMPPGAPVVAAPPAPAAPSPVLPPAPTRPAGPGEPVIDLGLGSSPDAPAPKKINLWPLIIVLGVLALIPVGMYVLKFIRAPAPARPVPAQPQDYTLEVEYEKLEANSKNIFLYQLRISRDGVLSVQIDDLANKRRVKKSKPVSRDYLLELSRAILASGFFKLDEDVRGLRSDDILESWDMSISVGRRAHRVRVVNRVEPDIFKDIRGRLEVFGKNELGLWAMQFSAEKLTDMAREAFLLAKKLSDEREMKLENLSQAIRSYEKVQVDLETVDPKPDFYAEALAGLRDCKRELQQRYEDRKYRANRSSQLQEWEPAARELKAILEMVPDRADPRNVEARKELLEIETRLSRTR